MKTKWISSKKAGVVLSYLMILLNTAVSVLLIPFYLRFLGIDGYGFYQMIWSLAGYVLILDFGIGTTMVRFLVEYKEKKDERGAQNFTAHWAVPVGLICVLIVVAGLIIRNCLGRIYTGLTADKILLGQRMLLLMIAVLIATVIERYMEGIAMANDSFSIVKCIGIVKLIVKFTFVLVFLYNGMGVMSPVIVEIITELLALLLFTIYNFLILRFKIRFYHFNGAVLRPAAIFMTAIMLQSAGAYLNNSADKTILGIMLGESASGIYGLSMTFITMYNMFPASVAAIFLPHATKMVINGADMEQHTLTAVKLGRFQWIICGGILSAFCVLGRDFIILWVGTNAGEIWLTALIVMIPGSIPLIQIYCLNMLDAMNKRMFRSVVLLCLSFLHIVLSVIMIRRMGMPGAPVSAGITYLIGHGVIINIYYRKIGLHVKKMWIGIMRGLLPAVIVTTIVTAPFMIYENVTWGSFFIKCILWTAVYCIALLIGSNDEERAAVRNMLPKRKTL